MSSNNDLNKLTIFRCKKIVEWAEEASWFDTTFVEDMCNKAERCETLTSNQIVAVKNIYDKFCE